MPDDLHIHCCSHILADSWVENLCSPVGKSMRDFRQTPGKQHRAHMAMVDRDSGEQPAEGTQLKRTRIMSLFTAKGCKFKYIWFVSEVH